MSDPNIIEEDAPAESEPRDEWERQWSGAIAGPPIPPPVPNGFDDPAEPVIGAVIDEGNRAWLDTLTAEQLDARAAVHPEPATVMVSDPLPSPHWFHVTALALPGLANASVLLGILEGVVRQGGIFRPEEADIVAATRVVLARAVMQEHGRVVWERAIRQADQGGATLLQDAALATAREGIPGG